MSKIQVINDNQDDEYSPPEICQDAMYAVGDGNPEKPGRSGVT